MPLAALGRLQQSAKSGQAGCPACLPCAVCRGALGSPHGQATGLWRPVALGLLQRQPGLPQGPYHESPEGLATVLENAACKQAPLEDADDAIMVQLDCPVWNRASPHPALRLTSAGRKGCTALWSLVHSVCLEVNLEQKKGLKG